MAKKINVIFSNRGDNDCKYLHLMWKGLESIGFQVQVTEITLNDLDFEEKVNAALSTECDYLILTGHGTEWGLLHPDIEKGIYLVHENNISLIKAKNVIGIWCFAREFATKHKDLHGFFSSMFISNVDEAREFGILDVHQSEIDSSTREFCLDVNWFIEKEVPLTEWLSQLYSEESKSTVETFNKMGLTIK